MNQFTKNNSRLIKEDIGWCKLAGQQLKVGLEAWALLVSRQCTCRWLPLCARQHLYTGSRRPLLLASRTWRPVYPAKSISPIASPFLLIARPSFWLPRFSRSRSDFCCSLTDWCIFHFEIIYFFLMSNCPAQISLRLFIVSSWAHSDSRITCSGV